MTITSAACAPFVIKLGGAAMFDLTVRELTCQEIARVARQGVPLVIVHGGGKEITALLDRLGVATRFERGIRVTDRETMDVTEMVLSGSVNPDIVTRICRAGVPAVGICGRSASLLQSIALDSNTYGLVGEVAKVSTKVIFDLLQDGYIPVISPIGVSSDGSALNLNADYAAAAIAGALESRHCLFLSDVDGIRTSNGVASSLSNLEVGQLIADGTITGGMIPKVECAIRALEAGCLKVTIANACKGGVIEGALSDLGFGTTLSLAH